MSRPATVELRGSLNDLIHCFDDCVEDFYSEPHKSEPFRRSSDNFRKGPCLYFHQAAIRHVRQHSHPFSEWLADDRHYQELLYGVLTAWGMNQGGARLKDFADFRQALVHLGSLEALERCRAVGLAHLTDQHRPLLEEVFKALADPGRSKIMASRPFVVGSSKLLHHLVPDLIPPIDNEYTYDGMLAYLEDEHRVTEPLESFEAVWRILTFFRKLVQGVTVEHIQARWLTNEQAYPMNTSVPKVIDNALISYSWRLWPEAEEER